MHACGVLLARVARDVFILARVACDVFLLARVTRDVFILARVTCDVFLLARVVCNVEWLHVAIGSRTGLRCRFVTCQNLCTMVFFMCFFPWSENICAAKENKKENIRKWVVQLLALVQTTRLTIFQVASDQVHTTHNWAKIFLPKRWERIYTTGSLTEISKNTTQAIVTTKRNGRNCNRERNWSIEIIV